MIKTPEGGQLSLSYSINFIDDFETIAWFKVARVVDLKLVFTD